MRAEIKRLHLDLNATTVYVTHDQVEAMAMADRIVVMSAAEVQQVGAPAQVYYDPANLFVARFIGSPGMNLIEGRLTRDVIELPGQGNRLIPPAQQLSFLRTALTSEDAIIVGFRPEAAALSDKGGVAGEVYAVDMHGAYKLLHVALADDVIVHVRADRQVHYPIGAVVRFDIQPEMERFFDPTTERAIGRNNGQESAR
jgi:multiple sugar transport system ATP-binding protein